MEDNNLPSNYAFTEDMKKSFQLNTRIDSQVTGGHICVMSFGNEVAQLVSRNLETFSSYSKIRRAIHKKSLEKDPFQQPIIVKFDLINRRVQRIRFNS